MKYLLIFFVGLMCLNISSAHTYLSSLVINGQALGELDCVRPYGNNYNFPISTVTSSDMTCGVPSGNANRKCPIPAGSSVGIQWHYEMPGASDTYIVDPTHRGPCMVYMAKSDTGAGPVWFKIFEEGYNAQNGQFCVDRLLASPQKGLLNFKIPNNLAPGNYLLRGEIVALHGAYVQGGAQPYVHCAEITITGSGTAQPTSDYLVSIPGAYSATDSGLLLSIYQPINNYIVPGPKVWTGNSGSTPAPAPTPTVITTGKKAASITTGKRLTSVTTGRALTTGRASNTGATKITTGAQMPTPAPVPVPTPSPSPSGSCSTGNMKCLTTNTYSTCSNSAWGTSQSCGSGLVCSPSGNYIYCVRPIVGAIESSPVEPMTPLPPVAVTPIPSFECSQALFGYQVCSGDSTYRTCVAGEQGPTWSVDLTCQSGLSCHPSETANNIYCY